MKIQVAIVTRNRYKHLEKCLISLTKQIDKPTSILIINNASSDRTKEVVELYKQRLKINYFLEPKIGIPFARNKAIESAEADILVFIDDDCEAFPNWIQSIVKSHNKYPDISAIQGRAISQPKKNILSLITEATMIAGFMGATRKKMNNINLTQFLKKDEKIKIMDTKNISFKLKILRKKRLKFNTQLKRCSDIDFAKRLEKESEDIIFCPSVKVYHWERTSKKDYLVQRFSDGKYRMIVHQIWAKQYFPSRGPLWWIKKSNDLLVYSIENGYSKKLLLIFSLYIAERFVFSLGVLFAEFSKFLKRPRPIQKNIIR